MLFYNEPTRGTFTTTTEKIIIVYDHCEDMAPGYCATLLHRGYSNVYLLSGGLRLVKDFVGYPLLVKKVFISIFFFRSIRQRVASFYVGLRIFCRVPPACEEGDESVLIQFQVSRGGARVCVCVVATVCVRFPLLVKKVIETFITILKLQNSHF